MGSRYADRPRTLAPMCGRVSVVQESGDYARFLDVVNKVESWEPRWNLGPQQKLMGARDHKNERTLDTFKWGLLPSWSKDERGSFTTFNARAETITAKPTFRTAFAKRRLLIPVDNYFEWHPKGKKGAQPYLFERTDGEPLVFAGLWEWWRAKGDEGDGILSASIITCEAGPDMEDIHNREPVALEPADWARWLAAETPADELLSMLHPGEPGRLHHYPVSKSMGAVSLKVDGENVRNDKPEFIEPIPQTEVDPEYWVA